MCGNVDYFDAAERHRSDADLLFREKRWPNADQLYGLAAECALKAIMKVLGMKLRPDGAPQKRRHRVHINELWEEFRTFAQGPRGARYAEMLPEDNPFKDWDINQRYYRTSALSPMKACVHRTASEQVFRAFRWAQLDGRGS